MIISHRRGQEKLRKASALSNARELHSRGFDVLVDPFDIYDSDILPRMAFGKFHIYMYELSDAEIIMMDAALEDYAAFFRTADDQGTVFCDQLLLRDVINFHMLIRNSEEFSSQSLMDISYEYNQHVSYSKIFPEIDSNHLIKLVQMLLEYYKNRA